SSQYCGAGTMARMSTSPTDRRARLQQPRLARELRTIEAMLRIGCRDRHGGGAPLCAECAALAEYTARRLAACPFGETKPTCSNCQIHCYGPREREAVREVMRYAGPRMLLRHPVLALRHVADGKRPAPPKPINKKGAARAP
ncbi:MAG: nitrous oxide-stimulated promoter family protein, partial [Betaproteobacteria bacterium]